MSRARHLLVWLCFATASIAVLWMYIWQGAALLRLEQAERTARQERLTNEIVRSALWRLDSYLSPLVTAECAWPMFGIQVNDSWEGQKVVKDRRTLSPLSDDSATTASGLTYVMLDSMLPKPIAPPLPDRGSIAGQALASVVQDEGAQIAAPAQQRGQQAVVAQQAAPVQQQIAGADLSNRMSQNIANIDSFSKVMYLNGIMTEPGLTNVATTDSCRMIWVNEELVIAARIPSNGKLAFGIRATSIDWSVLASVLEGRIRDLLPAARMERADIGGTAHPSELMLASLPVRLNPGAIPVNGLATAALRPIVLVAGAVIAAALALLGCMLWLMISLGERRRRFVSAVTHELRTPLTTFQLYSEMLAEGMVPEDKRPQYLATLQNESRRLKHLVENILAFARLERRGVMRSPQQIVLQKLISEQTPRLSESLAGASMQLEVEMPDHEIRIATEPDVIEQILFNLVDNARKYACDAADKRVHLAVSSDSVSVTIRVCDHGPGLPKRSLIRPFSVSSEEAAARRKPGIGLGLDLSRRLARHLGGRLTAETRDGFGACFALVLPAAD